ncbi:MAG: hypothetical protein K6G34_08720 [Lachnospiraceae bacterium]|nr:hypothetical protein [Lachnospiraceae bacterium]
MPKEKSSTPDAYFEDYSGKNIYLVSHPDHRKTLRVAAPDEQAAIVAAAERWNETWRDYRFYAYCKVIPG